MKHLKGTGFDRRGVWRLRSDSRVFSLAKEACSSEGGTELDAPPYVYVVAFECPALERLDM